MYDYNYLVGIAVETGYIVTGNKLIIASARDMKSRLASFIGS